MDEHSSSEGKPCTYGDNILKNNFQEIQNNTSKEKCLSEDKIDEFKRNFNLKEKGGWFQKGYDLLHFASETNEYKIGKLLLQNSLFKSKKINAKDIKH